MSPCAEKFLVDVREFVLGVDRTAFIENQRMIALKPGSAAERVGARKGDVVIGTGVYWNDVTRPVPVTIKGGKKVESLPLGSTRQIPQYQRPSQNAVSRERHPDSRTWRGRSEALCE